MNPYTRTEKTRSTKKEKKRKKNLIGQKKVGDRIMISRPLINPPQTLNTHTTKSRMNTHTTKSCMNSLFYIKSSPLKSTVKENFYTNFKNISQVTEFKQNKLIKDLVPSESFFQKKEKDPVNKGLFQENHYCHNEIYESIFKNLFATLTYKEKRIFWAISFFQNKFSKDFYVSQSKIAARAGCSVRTLGTCVRKLKDLGVGIKQRRRKGKFSTCYYHFDSEFQMILKFFVRANFFKHIQNKTLYKKHIKKQLLKFKKLFTAKGSFAEIFKAWDKLKKPVSHREIADGAPYIYNINLTYKSKRFIKQGGVNLNEKRESVKHAFKELFDKFKFPEHEQLHFSGYSDSVLVFAKEQFLFYQQSGKRIASPVKLFQYLINLGRQKQSKLRG